MNDDNIVDRRGWPAGGHACRGERDPPRYMCVQRKGAW